MKKRQLVITLIFVLALSFLLTGCIGGSEKEETTTTTEITTTEAPPPVYYNTLTGKSGLSEKAVGKRPVAVMINNIKASLPQYGIYKADIIYEILVEGGITRMMALYGDYTKVPKVCSVRSCRYYFPIFAHGYDAVYFCFGSNESLATPTLKRIGIDYFDGNQNPDSLVFGRDSERLKKYSREHTAYVNGQKIPELLNKYSVETASRYGETFRAFNFRDEAAPEAAGNITAKEVTLNFSKLYYSTFTYNSKTKTYYKTHCGNPHIDSSNDKQLNFTNVFALETEVDNYKGGSLMEVNWQSGTGYYISRGTAQKITWLKGSEDSNILFFDESGAELKVNAGKSYIGVIGTGLTKIKTEDPAN